MTILQGKPLHHVLYYTNATHTFANTLQEGEAQHSDLTAIVCLRHFSSNSTSSTVDQARMWSQAPVFEPYPHIRQVIIINIMVMEKSTTRLQVINTATITRC